MLSLMMPMFVLTMLMPIIYRFIRYLTDIGFSKEKEIAFPHKQSAFMRLRRETFNGPTL
jgi:hypothetical protein